MQQVSASTENLYGIDEIAAFRQTGLA